MALSVKKLAITVIGVAVAGFLGIKGYEKFVLKKWVFTDNYWGDGKKYKMSFIGKKFPPYVVGEKIVVKQHDGAKNKEYDGEHTVKGIYMADGQWVVATDFWWVSDTPANGGIMYSAKAVKKKKK
jgi:hypothetical protein